MITGNMNWSRRRVMSALAGASTTLMSFSTLSRAAQAEAAAAWRDYRNGEMGDPFTKSVDAQVELNDMLLGVHCTENRAAASAEDQYKLQREGMAAGGMAVTREEARTVSGNPARDFIRESGDLNYIYRVVNVGKRTIGISVFGERDIHGNPNVRRFLDSLTLLQGGR
jgi:hypothetical protein